MGSAGFVFGLGLMVTGIVLLLVAVFRSLGHVWRYGLYELWVLPVAGAALIVLGLGLTQSAAG